MANNAFSKLFSVEEANELIPRLQLLVRDLQNQAKLVRERVAQATGGETWQPPDLQALARSDPQIQAAARQMSVLAEQIEQYGCVLKDVDLGLVDFPGEIEGEVVFLCWQYGEPQVVAWHPVNEGFGSRRPLSGSRKVYLN